MKADNIISWIRGFFGDSGASAVIGISGGKDSTVAAALCAAALGRERVVGVLMPQGVQSDIDVSYAVCDFLGISGERRIEVNIGDAVTALYNAVPCKLGSVATSNTPARVRMAVLYAIAASVSGGGRVVCTCNLSEAYVGWETKFGDNVGDFSPLGNLTVGEVKAVGYALGLPAQFIEKIPVDGLQPKSDEEALGFSYAVLDRYLREGVCEDDAVLARIESLHRGSAHKRKPIPTFVQGTGNK
jgi:NAD+ synthase